MFGRKVERKLPMPALQYQVAILIRDIYYLFINAKIDDSVVHLRSFTFTRSAFLKYGLKPYSTDR